MKNSEERLRYLFQQYLANQISEAEYDELWKLLQSGGDREADNLSEELQLLWENAGNDAALTDGAEWQKKLQRLIGETATSVKSTAEKKAIKLSYKWAAAAAVIILLAAAGFYYHTRQPKRAVAVRHIQRTDILPGGNKAVLTLSNGATIILDSAANGMISRQGNTRILKPANGKITYSRVNSSPDDVVYNTLSTPRGGQYQLALPDGTLVWLNSTSSLRFPTSFSGNSRVVEMTGEAYFEIAKDPARPFIVTVDGMRVKVLGTHFNIMAYDDEPLIKTTLFSGAVSIKKDGAATLLSPGQQAQVTKGGEIQVVKNVKMEKVIAWKNNLFWFEENTIQEVMRQVARWYNVDVVITGNISRHFTGSIPRDVKVSKIFKVLQETGSIHFAIEDNKIIVSP